MTEVLIFHRSGRVVGFQMMGHAGAGGAEEFDMVCAAISGIAYTALGALDELCGILTYTEREGHLDMMVPENREPNVLNTSDIILKTMEIGLNQIQRQYPRYIRIVRREV